MGRKYPLIIQLLGLGERYELSQWGSERSPGRKLFYCNLISTDRLCWQQVTANSSPFHPEKWGYCTPSPKSGGTVTPRKLRLWIQCHCMLCILWWSAGPEPQTRHLGKQAFHVASVTTWTICHWILVWINTSNCRKPTQDINVFILTQQITVSQSKGSWHSMFQHLVSFVVVVVIIIF